MPAAPVYQQPAAGAPAPVAAPAVQQGGGALKIVLIAVAVLALLGIMAGGALVYVGYKAKKSLDNAVGSSGSMSMGVTGGSALKIASSMGVDVYPGAKEIKNSGSAVNFGGISNGGAEFETSDSVSQVAEFYRSKYPKATLSAEDEKSQTMMVGSPDGLVTIAVEDKGEGRTKITLSRMGGTAR